jgi:Protein of unknown function (DUF1254)
MLGSSLQSADKRKLFVHRASCPRLAGMLWRRASSQVTHPEGKSFICR